MPEKMYIATLYRFGYDLTVIGKTEKAARDALVKEYIRAYKSQNGTDPSEDYINDTVTYLENAIEDIEVREFEIGKVEWC